MNAKRTTLALATSIVFLAAACGGSDGETDASATPASTAAATETTVASNSELDSFAVEVDNDLDATTTTAAPATTAEETTTTAPPTTIGGDVDVFSFEVGDCFSEAGGDTVESLPIVSCDEEHDVEVYALYDLPDGDFPGDDVVIESASEGCLERFDAYVGIAYAESVYDINTIFPTENTWNNLFDREIVCLLVRIDGLPNIGSAEGTGI